MEIENKYMKIFHIWTNFNNNNPDYLLQDMTKTSQAEGSGKLILLAFCVLFG